MSYEIRLTVDEEPMEPTQRFIKQFDDMGGYYRDTKTGLKWALNNYGPMEWKDAADVSLRSAGLWRLPTIEELLTLVDYEKYRPATELPGMVSSYYWSSTTLVYNTSSAWYVNFYHGYDNRNGKSYDYYVRAVRGVPYKPDIFEAAYEPA